MDLLEFQYGDTVAIKTKLKVNGENWFTGRISSYYPPGVGVNKDKEWNDSALHVQIYLPVCPQWSDSEDFTTAFYSDLEHMILLERKPKEQKPEINVGFENIEQ